MRLTSSNSFADAAMNGVEDDLVVEERRGIADGVAS
jgi:hypothetical protein